MYDRAARVMILPVGSTSGAVGPGSYNVEQTSKTRIKMDAYAPFGSLVERNTGIIDEEQVVSVPGPGYYDGLLLNGKGGKQGGASLAFTAKRFVERKDLLPGPAAYNVSRARSEPELKAKSAPTLRTNRIKFVRNQEAPSIPVPNQAFGYEETEGGQLVKQAPPEQDSSLGPAFYTVPREEPGRTTKKYKGVFFGKMTAKRDDLFAVDHDLPGPGSYNSLGSKQRPMRENMNVIRETDGKHEKPTVLRFTEEVIVHEEKQKFPGPGQYKVPRAFDSAVKEKQEPEHPAFGSQAKRFTSKHQALPGPGSYNDPRGAFESMKRVTGLKRSPFGQTAARFERANSENPGPAAYSASEAIGQVTMRKLVMASARKGAFGSTAPRSQALVRTDEFNTPGPAEYQPKERPYAPRYNTLSSMFSSMSTRFGEQQQTEAEPPAPGAYDVARSFAKLHDPVVPRPPQSDEARKRRFAPGAAAAARNALAVIDEGVPAPDSYQPALLPDGRSAGVSMGKSSRFRTPPPDAPGPGTYSLAPSVRDSTWKPTFNITLGTVSDGLHTVAPGSVAAPQPSLLTSSKLSFLDAAARTRPTSFKTPVSVATN